MSFTHGHKSKNYYGVSIQNNSINENIFELI